MTRWSTPFSRIPPREIEWVWRRHIPAGMITALGGHPSRGKSLISFHIAAEVSRRGEHVLISNHEDRLREIARPRIAAAGADMEHVHAFSPRLRPLPEGFDQLHDEVTHYGAKLVILDPFTSHLSVPAGNAALVRRALEPVEELCEAAGCAVLIIPHQVKHARPNANPLMTVGGPAAGLVGFCRAVYLAGRNPIDPDEFVFVNAKPLGPVPPSLAFELDVSGIDDDEPEAGFLHFRGECAVTAQQLVEAQYREGQEEPKQSKSERAAEWLSRYLWAASEPCKPSEVAADAVRQEPPITARQLRRAAAELGTTNPEGGRGAMWALPDDLRSMLDAQFGSEAADG
jgi:hypothetical protein